MRIWHYASIGLLVAASPPALAQRPMGVVRARDFLLQLRDERHEAAAALQGNGLPGADTALVLDSALIEEVARAISVIRRQVPDLQKVAPDRIPFVLSITVDSGLGARMSLRAIPDGDNSWRMPLRDGMPITGESSLDSLGHTLRAVNATLTGPIASPHPFFELRVVFDIYVNVPAVARAYRRYPGVSVALPSRLDYTYADLGLAPWANGDGDWQMTFTEGRGDCPSGCTGSIKSILRYNRATHRAVLVGRDTTGLIPGPAL
jgi:hypothetical protein